jgi:hypothetical protein
MLLNNENWFFCLASLSVKCQEEKHEASLLITSISIAYFLKILTVFIIDAFIIDSKDKVLHSSPSRKFHLCMKELFTLCIEMNKRDKVIFTT